MIHGTAWGPIHLRTETDPVSETLWNFLPSTYKTMDKVQNKPNSSVKERYVLLATRFILVSCLAYSYTLKMEATHSSETSVDFQRTTLCYTPKDITLHKEKSSYTHILIYVKCKVPVKVKT
jgi:hypothetical protein